LVLLALVMAATGCSARRPQPVVGDELGDQGFSLDGQQLGVASDGLVLRSIRHAPHDGFYRVVFDLGLAEGKPARTAPHTSAVYRSHDRSIEIIIAGVREDLTGNLPLRTENGSPFGKPVPIDHPPIRHIARALVLDDSEVAYRIQLTREARYRLGSLDDPARIVVDIEDTGGARPAPKERRGP
jgi:hypothetical protein